MDITDIKILNALSDNARMSASELSEKVNLSVSAVSERIRKLESSGAIAQYSIILDEQRFGLDVTAYICVLMDHPRYNEQLIAYAKKKNDIVEISYIAGDYDFIMKVRTESTQTLERLLDEVKSVTGVGRTKTMFVLSTAKLTYSPKLNEYKEKKRNEWPADRDLYR